MKCPYPDCTGEVTPGEQFCGECGRALTWQNGQPLAMSAEGPPTMGAVAVVISGRSRAPAHQTVEVCGYYWHFVDVVWVVMFSTIYVLR